MHKQTKNLRLLVAFLGAYCLGEDLLIDSDCFVALAVTGDTEYIGTIRTFVTLFYIVLEVTLGNSATS